MESNKAQAVLLFNCVHQGHVNVLRKLLKAGANPNVFDGEGEPLIFVPVVNGDYETLEALLESDCCDINIKSLDSATSALTTAVGLDDLDMVKFLIKSGADVDCIDESGKSPLLLALQDGKFKIAQYLMKQGGDVNVVDGLGQSALFLIANGGNSDCLKTVKKLMKYGYSLEKDSSWISPDEIDFEKVQNAPKINKLLKKFTSKLLSFPSLQSSIKCNCTT
ncbi:sex-determining protein fem-1-like [Ostrea edulis]|uniref:sex-determining protein fem-1-like n=1 Tax=Ostrea edulis TaxID=37623 RepID=UPI0024AF43E8|nr:sex-determining protein fem-1-like [Ostrea edulis]